MSTKGSAIKRLVLSLFVVGGMAVAGIAGAGLGGGAVYLAVQDKLSQLTVPAATQPAQPIQAAQPAATAAPAAGQVTTISVDSAVTDAVAQVGPAVVTVINNLGDGSQASGSGVIISPDGYVVTNNHVVDGSSSLQVIFQDGQTVSADLIGVDAVADVAVIKVPDPAPAYAEFGDSEALKPGETVIAIGSPLGDFRNTVTVGVVSATHRSLDDAGFTGDLIQTDAAINHGNSGGPLVNLAGQVVGLSTLVVRGNAFSGDQAEGLGFAVASSTVKFVSGQLIDQGYVSRPYLGISWAAVTPEIAAANDLPAQWGAYVTEVSVGTPAQEAGLQKGDIITGLDGQSIDADNTFPILLYQHAPGDQVQLAYVRGNDARTASLTLVERPRTG